MMKIYNAMSDVGIVTVLLLYYLLFFLAAKKCFFEKSSVLKNVLTILVTFLTLPYVVYLGALMLCSALLKSLERGSMLQQLIYYLILMGVIVLFMFVGTMLFIAYVKPKNRSLGNFFYFIFYIIAIVDQKLISNAVTRSDELAVGIYSLIVFYLVWHYLVRQLAKLLKTGYETDSKMFILMPTGTLVYVLLLDFLEFQMNEEVSRITIELIYISFMFMTIVLIVAFNVILRNIRHMGDIKVRNMEIEAARDDIKTMSLEVMEALAHTIDAKDEYTKGHSQRVAQYSRLMAEHMGLSQEDCDNIYYMGLLHDIGKIGVPDAVINKPGRLDDDEFAKIKEHPGKGAKILGSMPELVAGARWHHERFDGRGYPDGLSGIDIPEVARIIAVADAYDAMSSNRSYRREMPQEKVREQIEKGSGSQFDPRFAEIMISMIDEDKEYTMREV